MKKISVIVPIYNSSKTLNKCIESIINQDYDNFEVLLINDGSTDNSLDICLDYEKKYSKIKVINKKNSGVSAARNSGIKESSGDYLLFIDSDDYIEKDMFKKLSKYFKYDYILFGYFIDYNNSKIIKKLTPFSHKKLTDFSSNFPILYSEDYINSPWNKVYKKELITTMFPENMNLGEDLVFNLNYLKNCKSIIGIDECFYDYYIFNTQSLSQKYKDDQFENALNLYKAVVDFCNDSFKNYNILYINNKLLEDCFSIMQKMIFSGTFKKREFCEKVKYMRETNEVDSVLKNYKVNNLQYKLIHYLFKLKKFKIIYLFFKLKDMIK